MTNRIVTLNRAQNAQNRPLARECAERDARSRHAAIGALVADSARASARGAAGAARDSRSALASESTATLNARYLRHCDIVNTTRDTTTRRYSMSVARGLYLLLQERALHGDDAAVIGGPHWLTYTPEQMRRMP